MQNRSHIMKIAIKVSEIASLIGMNCFRSRDTIIKCIRDRVYSNYIFNCEQRVSSSACESLIDNISTTTNILETDLSFRKTETTTQVLNEETPFLSEREDDTQVLNDDDKYICEFDTFYIYCYKTEVNINIEGYLIENKLRISDKVKHFIPLIDLIHIQFYLLLTRCRRCLLCESWTNDYSRNTYIKYDQTKIDTYINLLSEAVNYICDY